MIGSTNFPIQFLSGVWAFITSLPYAYFWELLHDVVLVLDIGLLTILLFLMFELRKFRPVLLRNPRDVLKGTKKIPTLRDTGLAERWKSILAKSEAAPPQTLLLAIIEADSFVDDILKRMGIAGEHMADRLEKIDTGDLQTLDKLWTAHRARNNLVHEPGYVLSESRAREFLKDYGDFLKELGVLE